MSEIHWGIIGCGDVTEIKSGPAFNKVPNSKLVAVMRRNSDKARDYAQRHNVPKWYDDADKIINDPDVTAIYIATPPVNHEEYTLRAIAAGKPVYVEKPMTMNAASAQRMIDAANNSGVKLCVAHYRREQPLFRKIKSLLTDDAIGQPRIALLRLFQAPQASLVAMTEVNWRIDPSISGGGLFHDLAPHQLDLMHFFFGEPSIASGISTNQGGLYKAPDIVVGKIHFKSGVVFNGSWCFTTSPNDEQDFCEIYGDKGKITFSVFQHEPVVLKRAGKEEKFPFERLQHVQQPMIQKVVEYFLGGDRNPCSGNDGLLSMQLLDAFTKDQYK